jgi:fluoride exporter
VLRTDAPCRRRLRSAAILFVVVRAVRGAPWPVLAVISAGGALGAVARYGLGLALPSRPGGFPWATFVVNASGCLLMGALMVLATDVWPARRLLRPFLGTGLLGGYTTFSTYVVEAQHLLDDGAARTALGYLAATALTAVVAVACGAATMRLALRREHPTGRRPS